MRIYKVEFIDYTNALKDTVRNDDPIDAQKRPYIHTEKNTGFLFVMERDIEYIKQFGNGIKSMNLVGELFNPINICSDCGCEFTITA